MSTTRIAAAAARAKYDELIHNIVNAHPAGFGNAGAIGLDQHQLAIVLACTEDTDVMEQVLQDKHCLFELRNAVNPANEDLEGALGAIVLSWVDIYAQARVFDDVQAEVRRRETEAGEAEEAAEHGAHRLTAADFAEVGL